MDSEITNGVRFVSIRAGGVELSGEYVPLRGARGLVVLACANRGNARSSAEQSLIERLHRSRVSTLRIDLMADEEIATERSAESLRQDVDLLAQRVRVIGRWAQKQSVSQGVALGYYGSGAAACAALRLASKQPPGIDALVICEVKSDFDATRNPHPGSRDAAHTGTELDAEVICDLFRNWLSWEDKGPARAPRSRPGQDRPSVAP